MIVFAYVFAIYSIMNIEEVISSGLPVLWVYGKGWLKAN